MSWDGFLKGLETDGGKMLVIIFMLIFIIGSALLMAETHHPLQEEGKQMAVGATASLLTRLYDYLKRGN